MKYSKKETDQQDIYSAHLNMTQSPGTSSAILWPVSLEMKNMLTN